MSPHLHISPETRFLRLAGSLPLASGDRLGGLEVAYRTWGTLAPARDNAVVVCHALTGSADVDRWWSGLLGPGRALDPERDFVIAANLLGSCYGTTGPLSPRPSPDGAPSRWGAAFPAITVRDQARLYNRLLDALGIERVRLVLGGSLGGMVALEMVALETDGSREAGRFERLALFSAPVRHGPWGIALSELGRRAIELDPKYRGGAYPPEDPPAAGLALARALAMTSYRSRPGFEQRFGRRVRDGRFEVARYLEHQGRKLVSRFDANSYLTLLRAMDGHDLARGGESAASVARRLTLPALVVASSTDVLYPPEDQLELATYLPRAEYVEIGSVHGHDAFLVEQETVERIVRDFRQRTERGESEAPRLAAAGGAG